MYDKWELALFSEPRINWNDAILKLRACGNESGIYPDVAYLLFRMANEPSVSSVLEFGSGLSTYVLAKTCLKLNNKEIRTIESREKWSHPAKCIVKIHGIDLSFYCTSDVEGVPVFEKDKQWDLVWVDGDISEELDRVGACYHYASHLENAVLMFDDAQDSYRGIDACIEGLGRSLDNAMWFNPSGRTDRHVRISFPTDNHPLLKVVEECTLP